MKKINYLSKSHRNHALKMTDAEYETMLKALQWFEKCRPVMAELEKIIDAFEVSMTGPSSIMTR